MFFPKASAGSESAEEKRERMYAYEPETTPTETGGMV